MTTPPLCCFVMCPLFTQKPSVEALAMSSSSLFLHLKQNLEHLVWSHNLPIFVSSSFLNFYSPMFKLMQLSLSYLEGSLLTLEVPAQSLGWLWATTIWELQHNSGPIRLLWDSHPLGLHDPAPTSLLSDLITEPSLDSDIPVPFRMRISQSSAALPSSYYPWYVSIGVTFITSSLLCPIIRLSTNFFTCKLKTFFSQTESLIW